MSPFHFITYPDPNEPPIAQSLEDLGLVGNDLIDGWVKLAQRLAAENGGFLSLDSPELYPLPTVPLDSDVYHSRLMGTVALLDVREVSLGYEPDVRKPLMRFPDAIWDGWEQGEIIDYSKKYVSEETLAEHVRAAETIAEENGGLLPLSDIGYLRSIIRRYPERFSHIERENDPIGYRGHRRGRPRERLDWVGLAESLAAKNEGLLPYKAKLRNMGQGSLIYVMFKEPEKFAHIEQESRPILYRRPEKDWVGIAEKIAADNEGKIPTNSDLRRDGQGGLVAVMTRNPEKFAHIARATENTILDVEPEPVKITTLTMQVMVAKKLVKRMGKFPSDEWLMENMSGLYQAKHEHPEAFAHLMTK